MSRRGGRTLRVTVVGLVGCGKTTLVSALVGAPAAQTTTTTAVKWSEMDFASGVPGDSNWKVMLLDTPGQFGNPDFPKWLAEGDAFILCYSVAEPRSLDLLDGLMEVICNQYKQYKHLDCPPLVLVGLQSDLERKVGATAGADRAYAFGCPHVEVSTKNAVNVDQVIPQLSMEVVRLQLDSQRRETISQERAQRQSRSGVRMSVLLPPNFNATQQTPSTNPRDLPMPEGLTVMDANGRPVSVMIPKLSAAEEPRAPPTAPAPMPTGPPRPTGAGNDAQNMAFLSSITSNDGESDEEEGGSAGLKLPKSSSGTINSGARSRETSPTRGTPARPPRAEGPTSPRAADTPTSPTGAAKTPARRDGAAATVATTPAAADTAPRRAAPAASTPTAPTATTSTAAAAGASGAPTSGKRDLSEYPKGQVLYAYEARNDTELTMKVGELVTILKETSAGWWYGDLNSKRGYFPASYVHLVEYKVVENEQSLGKTGTTQLPDNQAILRLTKYPEMAVAAAQTQGTVMEGNLSKVGGKFKSWKKRWMVLTRTGVFYYKNESDAKKKRNELGLVPLIGTQHVKPNSTKEHCFELPAPGRTYLFTASNREEMQAWITAISQLQQRDMCFGVPLNILQEKYQRQTTGQQRLVPIIIQKCVQFVERTGVVTEQGIYRISGLITELQSLRALFDENEANVDPDFPEFGADPNNITGVLKMWLRALPEPIIPYRVYNDFITLQKKNDDPTLFERRMPRLKELVRELPPPNLAILSYLIQHLRYVSEFKEQNKMPALNLSIVFGPTLMWAQPPAVPNPAADVESLMQTKFQAATVCDMILYFDQVFPGV